MKTPVRVGLTGGIGSGKSTVARMFSDHGVPVIDLDALGHDLLERDHGLQKSIAREFGTRVLDESGHVDRQKLGGIVFSRPDLLKRLNDMLHPLIWQKAEDWIARQTTSYVLIEASVLIESGGTDRVDVLVVVLAPEEERMRRVISRPGYDRKKVRQIMARQCDDAQRRAAADYVIDNSGDIKALNLQVSRLMTVLERKFGRAERASS